ncbi:hypothetical protein AB1L30_14050 [Bremerella sp. JC817]|uniref:hypothetical protein n=1 Tax=Bremerella sp. JC817 TaxID=3231756 RepID=UPI00345A72DF
MIKTFKSFSMRQMLLAIGVVAVLAFMVTRWGPLLTGETQPHFWFIRDAAAGKYPLIRSGFLHDKDGVHVIVLSQIHSEAMLPEDHFPAWFSLDKSSRDGPIVLIDGQPLIPPEQGILVVSSIDDGEPLTQTIAVSDLPHAPGLIMPTDAPVIWKLVAASHEPSETEP